MCHILIRMNMDEYGWVNAATTKTLKTIFTHLAYLLTSSLIQLNKWIHSLSNTMKISLQLQFVNCSRLVEEKPMQMI